MQKGISSQKAAEILKTHGENLLASDKKESAAGIFFSQFKDLLTLILLGAAAVSDDPKNRLIYDYTYQFIKKTLKLAPDARDAMSFTCETDKPFVGTLAPESEKNVSYTVSISPAHGTVTINADGTFVYYPDKGYTGTDTFSYCISEQLGFSDATYFSRVFKKTMGVPPVQYRKRLREKEGNSEKT